MSFASHTIDDATPPIGSIVAGKFRVEEVLGRGGMGVVVRATSLRDGEAVALKFLHGKAAGDPDYVERFLREARAALRVKSEHVARVLDVGTLDGGAPYIVMELLLGEDLHHVTAERRTLPIAEAVGYIQQATRAIAEAHSLSIVHRDLKPANLFVTRRPDGSAVVKVLDFGISKTLDGSDRSLTMTGDVLGSPLYMSPEQIRDPRRVDARSDIWGLGNILYRLLAGRAPFAAATAAGTLAKIVADEPPSLRAARPDVPEELERIVLRCMEKNADKRFQRADELGAALAAFLQGPSPAPAPRRVVGRKGLTGTIRMDSPASDLAASSSATYAAAVLASSVVQAPPSSGAGSAAPDSRSEPHRVPSPIKPTTTEKNRPSPPRPAAPALGVALTLFTVAALAVTSFVLARRSPSPATPVTGQVSASAEAPPSSR